MPCSNKVFAAILIVLLFPLPSFSFAEDAITEIKLERIMCGGICPDYELKLSSNGDAFYEGKHYVKKMGKYRSAIGHESFNALVKIINDNDFFSLKPRYEAGATDLSATVVTVIRNGKVTIVFDYGDFGPKRLHVIQDEIDSVANRLKWEYELEQ